MAIWVRSVRAAPVPPGETEDARIVLVPRWVGVVSLACQREGLCRKNTIGKMIKWDHTGCWVVGFVLHRGAVPAAFVDSRIAKSGRGSILKGIGGNQGDSLEPAGR